MQKGNISKFLFIFCVLIIVGNIIYHIFLYKDSIFAKFDFSYWEYRYNHSQWMPLTWCKQENKSSCQPISIGDDGLYMYVGGAYLRGKDPTLLNAEIPPFGKYIIGMFEQITGIVGAFSLFFGCLSLILLYIFNKLVFKSSMLAIIPVTLFSFELLFIEQLKAPYLDTIYLCALLLSFVCFLKKRYILTGLFIGLFMSIKSPFLVALVFATFGTYWLITKFFPTKKGVYIVAISFLVYVLTYLRTFILGHNFLYLLKVQKFIIHFYQSGAKAVIGAVIPMMLFGQWYTWFGQTSRVDEWHIGWTVLFISFFIALFIMFIKKNYEKEVLFMTIWVCFYFLFLIFTPVFSRYLLLVIPFLYNLVVWVLLKNTKLKSFLLS